MSKKEPVEVGSHVVTGTGAGKKGIVRFIGETEFATGEWIGIELVDGSEGKNDGSVAGVRYFTCPEKCGLFVKRLQVKLDKDHPQPTVTTRPQTSKLPSFDEKKKIPEPSTISKKSSEEDMAPAVAPTVTATVAAPAPAPSPMSPSPKNELTRNTSNSQNQDKEISSLQETLSRVTAELEEERKEKELIQQRHREELERSQEKILRLENENKASVEITSSSALREVEECKKQHEEMLSLKDEKISALEDRVMKLVAESDQEKEKLSREIHLLKGMMQDQQTSDSSDQQRCVSLMSELTSLQSQYTSLLHEHNTLLSSNQQKLQEVQRDHQAELENEQTLRSQLEKKLKQETERSREALRACEEKSQEVVRSLQKQIQELEEELRTERNEKAQLQHSSSQSKREEERSNATASQLKDLENQIAELTDNLEMVTLDAEQKQFELEERIHELEMTLAEKEKLEEIAPPSSPSDSATSAVDLQDQNNRLKEALRRLQALHLTNEKNLQSVVTKYEEELKSLQEEKNVLEGSHERAEELQLQLEVQQEEMRELAQQIDDTSVYADMVESLSTKNTELSAEVQRCQEIIHDLETTQEIQDELDQSQRQEIEMLRKGNDSLLIGIQTIETEKGELYRKISDYKLKNERLAKVIERLQEEAMILKSQIEEEKSDMQLVSSRVLDERMLRRLLQEERSRVQKLKISLSNSKQSQLVAESQATRLQLLVMPLLQHISSHATSPLHSIPVLPVDSTNDLSSHLLSLPSLRSPSSSPFALTTTSLQNLLESLEMTPSSSKTDATNTELFHFYFESLLSSILFNTTSVLSHCSSSCSLYLHKQKELLTQTQLPDESDSILFSYSSESVRTLSTVAQNMMTLFSLSWHLLGVLAYLSVGGVTSSFYSELESSLWVFKEYEVFLQHFLQNSLHSKEYLERTPREEVKQQLQKKQKQLEGVITKLLSVVPLTAVAAEEEVESQEIWHKIFTGDRIDPPTASSSPRLQWHQDLNGTVLLMNISLGVIDVQLEFPEEGSEQECVDLHRSLEGVCKHLDRINSESVSCGRTLMLLSSKYSQLHTLTESLLTQTQHSPSLSTTTLLDQIALTLQTVTESSRTESSIGIISAILSSITSQQPLSSSSSAIAAAAPYSWLIDGILPGKSQESSSSSEYCLWVRRGLRAGKSLVSIVEMEEEVKRLKEEKSVLQSKEEMLSVEKRALSKRLEDNERMLEKYVKEKREVREEEEAGRGKKSNEEIEVLKKENKVLSEALDVMNAQLLELEEQVSQKQPSPLKKNNSKTSSSSSGTTSATGHKKREDAHQLTPRSPHEISSRETTPHSPYDSTSTLSPSDVAVTISSPVLQQLFVSLTQEIHNWKLLASSRLMQSMKLSPLPTPRKHSCHPQLLSPGNGSQDQGSEERKESEVKGVTDVKNIRQEVHQLKRNIRLARASVRVPLLTREDEEVCSGVDDRHKKWNGSDHKLKELKQINHLSALLQDCQLKNRLCSLHQ